MFGRYRNRSKSAVDPDDAIVEATAAVAESSADARAAGDAARDRGDWAEAAQAYARHLEADCEDFDIWVQLGHSRKESGDLAGADTAYRAALDLKPDDADLLLNHGHLLKLRGDLAAAAKAYRHSFELDHNRAAADELTNPKLRPFLLDAERSVAARGGDALSRRYPQPRSVFWIGSRAGPQKAGRWTGQCRTAPPKSCFFRTASLSERQRHRCSAAI